MNAREKEERELIAQAIACARVGEATHWPTVAAHLVAEIDQLQAELAELREERRRVGRVIAGAAGSFARPLPVDELAVPQGRILVTDPATANLINKAKAAHEVMLRSQDEMDEANVPIGPHIQAAMREVRHEIGESGLVSGGRDPLARLTCTCGWQAEIELGTAERVAMVMGLHRQHPESTAAELATDLVMGLAVGTTHTRVHDQSGDSTTETPVSRQDNGS